MNLAELSNEFDITFENLATSGSKGLNEYEKSLAYTYAQEGLTRDLAGAGVLDPVASLVKRSEELNSTVSLYDTALEFTKIVDPFFTLGYHLKSNTANQSDIPLTTTGEAFINNNLLTSAYKYPPRNVAYVVMGESKLTVFPPYSYDVKSVVTTYLDKPSPIILDNLIDGYSIDGITVPTNPVIGESYHQVLVQKAVQFAIELYIGQQEKEVSNDNK